MIHRNEITNSNSLEAHLLDAHNETVSAVPRDGRTWRLLNRWHDEAHEEGRCAYPHDHRGPDRPDSECGWMPGPGSAACGLAHGHLGQHVLTLDIEFDTALADAYTDANRFDASIAGAVANVAPDPRLVEARQLAVEDVLDCLGIPLLGMSRELDELSHSDMRRARRHATRLVGLLDDVLADPQLPEAV